MTLENPIPAPSLMSNEAFTSFVSELVSFDVAFSYTIVPTAENQTERVVIINPIDTNDFLGLQTALTTLATTFGYTLSSDAETTTLSFGLSVPPPTPIPNAENSDPTRVVVPEQTPEDIEEILDPNNNIVEPTS